MMNEEANRQGGV